MLTSNTQSAGVPLAPSDVSKVLLVSQKSTSQSQHLLQHWNKCKQDLLKAAADVESQKHDFWSKVLAKKVSIGLKTFAVAEAVMKRFQSNMLVSGTQAAVSCKSVIPQLLRVSM